VAFSPIAISTPVALRSLCCRTEVPGGQIGLDPMRVRRLHGGDRRVDPPGSQAQLVSTLIDAWLGPGARRGDRFRFAVQLDVAITALQRACVLRFTLSTLPAH
jgi:hypothetical protein